MDTSKETLETKIDPIELSNKIKLYFIEVHEQLLELERIMQTTFGQYRVAIKKLPAAEQTKFEKELYFMGAIHEHSGDNDLENLSYRSREYAEHYLGLHSRENTIEDCSYCTAENEYVTKYSESNYTQI